MADNNSRRKLYNALNGEGKYTKSYEEFCTQFENAGSRHKLYEALNGEGKYTKSEKDFDAQFFGDMMQPEEVRSAGAQMGAEVKREQEEKAAEQGGMMNSGVGLPLWKTAGKGWSGVPKVEWSPSEGVIGTQEEARQAAVGMVNTDPGVIHYVNDEEREQLRKNLVENRKRSNLPGFTADELRIAVDDAVARENKWRKGMMGAVARNGKRYDESTAEGRRMNMLVDRYVGNINTNKKTPIEVESDAVSLFSLTPKGQDIIARYENGKIDEETYRSEMLGGLAEDMGSFLNANKMALGERNSEGSVLALEDKIAKRGDMFVKEYKSKDKNENIVLKALRSMGGNPAVDMDAGKSDLYDRYRMKHPELVAAGKLVQESKNMISGARANGFWEALGKGLLHESTNIDNWASYNKIENNVAIMNVVDKYNKKGEEALNDEEKLLLDAMVANAATTLFYGGKLGDAYKAGAATGASIPFMVEFALLPYSGAESAIGKALTKWGGKIVAKAGGKGLGKVGEFVANKVLPQIGSSLLFTTTADIGKVIGGGMERMNGKTDVTMNNETGEFEYAGQNGQQDFWGAMGNAYAEVAAGNYTERALDPFISKIRGAVGGALRKGTYNVSGLGRVFSNVFDNPLMKGAQFEGLLGEFSEEMFNNFLTGAICSDQNIADNFTFDKTKETLEGLLPTQFFFSMFGLGRGAVMQYRANKYVGQEREALQKFFENFGTMPEGLEDNGKIKVLTMEASERMARAMARYQNGEEGYEAEDFDKEVDDIKRAYRLGMSELIEAAAEERAARLREERVAASEQLRANAEGGVAALTSTEEQIRTNNERINGELEKVEAFREAVASFRSAMEIEEDLMNELSEESGLSREQLRVILNKQSKDMSDDELAISDRFNEQKAVRTYTEAEVRRRTIETKGKIGRDGNITNIEVDGRKGTLISTVNGITVWRDEEGNINQCTNDMVKVESVQNADEVLDNVERLVRDEVTTAVRHTPGSVVKYGDRFYLVGENDGESVELLDIADPKNPQSIKVGVSEMAQVPEFRVKRNSVLKRSGVVIKDYDPDTNTYETSAGKKTAAEVLELANQGREVLDNLEISGAEEKKEEEAKAREEARSETVKGIVKKAKEFAAENREVAGVEDDGTLYIIAKVKEIEKARGENEKKLKKAKGEFVNMTDAGKREKAKAEIARLEGEVASANGQIAMYEEARGLLSDDRVEKVEERLREEASELRREEEERSHAEPQGPQRGAEGETPELSEQERVEEMAGKLGVKVKFVSREEIGNEEVEGYYNTETGEIVLCPENCEEGRMEFVLFHETVGHYGLRRLFKGNVEKMGAMLDAIYAGMTKGDIEARVRECEKNPRWEKMSEGDRVRLVAEEHFARTAEEYLRRKNEGTLNEEIEEKAKSIFERFMEVLRELFGVKAMGFDDVMALAAASARNLEEEAEMELREIEAEVDGVFERAKESGRWNVLIGSYKGSVQAKANRLEKKIAGMEDAAERAKLEHELDMQRRRLEFVELRGKTNDEIEEAAEGKFIEENMAKLQPTEEQKKAAVEEVKKVWESGNFSRETKKELKETAAEVAGSRAAMEVLTDTGPRSVAEVAAQMLGSGKTKISRYDTDSDGWKARGGVNKGVESETGMKGELKRFPFLFVPNAPNGEDVLTLEGFAERVEESCKADGIPCEDTQEARNAVIEVIQGAEVPTDFKEYIVRGRMEEARRLRNEEVNMTESELMRMVMYSVKLTEKDVQLTDEDRIKLRQDNERFNADLRRQINGELAGDYIYNLGNPLSILKATGIPDLPIHLRASKLKEKANTERHLFDLSDVMNLANAMQEPLAVFKYGDEAKSQNIVLEINKDDKQFVVGLFINPEVNGRTLEINNIRTIFPKDNAEWLNWITKDLLLYGNIEKIKALIDKQRMTFADVKYLDLDLTAKVLQNFELNSKNKKKNSENFEEGEVADNEGNVRYSIRKEAAPKKTGVGYKVFFRGKDGQLYPPMVANPNGEATPVGVWLNADEGQRAEDSKTGRPQVKQGGKGTQGGSGKLAYRPGWRLGTIPYALQFNRKDENGEKTLFPKDFVWAEVEYAMDNDYQEEAMQEGVNKNGKFQHSLAGLKHIPTDGYYMYRTNPNPETDPWIITGAMKVNRVLTKEEVDELVKKAGREPQRVEDEVKANDGSVVRKVGEGIEIDAPDGVRYSIRVYHGSAADFKEFDHSFMGSGEGAQVYGWGTYVSAVKGIGKAYADTAKRNAEYRQKHEQGWWKNGFKLNGENYDKFTPAEVDAIEWLNFDFNFNDVERAIKEIGDCTIFYLNTINEGIDEFKREKYERHVKELEEAKKVLEDIKSGKSDLKFHKAEMKPVERHLYEVEIPDDNNGNYLRYNSKLEGEQREAVKEAVMRQLQGMADKYWKGVIPPSKLTELDKLLDGFSNSGLASILECKDEEVSRILNAAGFVGVKVPTGYLRGGDGRGMNYVIFNEKDAKIVDNVRFSVRPEEVSEVVGSDVRESEEYERSEEGKEEQEKLNVSGGAMSAVADAAAKRVAAVMANEPKYGQVEGETMIQFFGRYNKWYEEMKNKKIEDEEARREYERVFKAQVPMIPQFEGSKMTVMEYMKAFEETRTVLDMCGIADDFNKLQAQRREVWLKLERVMWERNNMLRKWQSDVARMLGLGEELPEQYDVLGALNRMSSVVNERAKMYENGEYKGLVDAVAAISREAEVTWGARERQRRKGKMFRQNVRRAERVSFEDVNGERWEPKWMWQNVDDESTLEGDRRNGQLLTPVECIELYLQAKDALEAESLGLADRGLEGFANQIEAAGNVNMMSAERVVAEFEEHIGEEKCLALQKATREATVFAMDELLRGGLISQAQYNQTLQYDEKSNTYKRQHYVPQRGWAYEAYLDQSMFGDAMKAAKGRSTLATSPLAYIDIIAKSSIQAAEKNLAKMKLWQLTQDQRANGELSRAFVAKRVYRYEYVNPQTQEKEVIESLMPPVEGMKASERVMYNNQKKYERDEESTVRVQVEGVIYDIHINDKQVARNINGMYANEKTAKVLDGVQRALTGKWFGGKSYNDLTKFFSALKTQFNPVFALSNLMRDMGFAFTINTIEHGYGFAAKALGNSFAATGVIHDYLLGKLDESGSKYADMFREFKDGGGITGYSFATDLPELRETMAKAMERAEKRAKRDKAKKGREAGELGFFKYLSEELRNADLKTAGESVKGFVERISQLSELMTRFGQYVTARESGMSVEESVNQAKEITTNFNRSGEISAILGPVYYFTNATLQGGYRIIRAGMKHPGKLAAHCAGWMLMGAIAAILQPDDPDDERYIADYVWQTYLPIGRVKIPLPHFFRTMFYMGANIAWAYQGRKTAAEAVLDGVSNIIEDNMASPLKLLEYVEMNKQMRAEEEHWYDEFGRFEFNVKRKIRDMVPSLIQPVSDTSDLFNMMFTGAKIHKEKYNENDVVNDTQMHFDNTDPRFVAACEWLQRMTGGTNNPKDNRGIALNPGDVQYVVGQYASGAPLEVMKLVGNLVDVANIAAGDMDGKDFPWDKAFLFGRFYQPYKQDQMEDAYYWNLKKTADAYASFEKGFKETDREEYRKWKGSEKHDLWKETKHTLKPINKKMQAGEPLEAEEIEGMIELDKRWNEVGEK